MKEVRVVIMGGGGVGKSALTVQFVKNYFVSTYDPTIEDTFRKTIPIDGQDCLVEILDTAGADTFVALKELYMKSGQGFILVFSLTHLGSVNELGPLREQIMRIKGSKVPLVLVGNKSDLRSDRQVPREVGTNLSRAWDNVPYYEASARKRINVDEVFIDIVRQCRQYEKLHGTATTGGSGGNSGSTSKKAKDGKGKKGCVVM